MNMTKQRDEELEELVKYYDRQTKAGLYLFIGIMLLIVAGVALSAVFS